MLRLAHVFGLAVACLAAGPVSAHADDSFALIITGASGGAEYAETYDRWRQELVTALRAQPEFRDDHLTVLAETPGPRVGRASRAGVTRALDRIRVRMTADSVLLIVLFGHGSYDGVDAKFNLVGPDLGAGAWDTLLDQMPGRVVVVNTTAASFPFLRRLAGPGRIVITATASSVQRYDTIFPEFFVAAFTDESADRDKNGRVSVWEAFEFASAGVRRWFQRQGRLATERGVLDDTGNGEGREAGQDGADGFLAARTFVGAGIDPLPLVTESSLVPLVGRRNALEDEVAHLRSRKNEVAPDDYWRELERLLVELARTSREIRRRTATS